MITHLQKTWKIQNKVTYSSTVYYNYFSVDKLRFLVGVSISNSQKLVEWMYREVEGCRKWKWSLSVRLCDPIDSSLPCSSIHGIFQARVLEWIAISFSRRPSWPGDRTRVSCILGRGFTVWATRKYVNPNLPVHPTSPPFPRGVCMFDLYVCDSVL